jgi:hypothetical protein
MRDEDKAKCVERTVIAFHGKQRVKEFYLKRLREHRTADQLRQHFEYWSKDGEDGLFRGCALGCTLHSGDYAAYEAELGIPSVLALLEDGIFESLPSARAMAWPEEFLSAIRPGADLKAVWPQFAYWLLVDPEYGLMQFAERSKTKESVQKVGHLYKRWIDGEKIGDDEFTAAYAFAFAAASVSVFGTGDAYAARATTYAAAAAYAYANAAGAANVACEATVEPAKWRKAQADKLLALMAAAPISELELNRSLVYCSE